MENNLSQNVLSEPISIINANLPLASLIPKQISVVYSDSGNDGKNSVTFIQQIVKDN